MSLPLDDILRVRFSEVTETPSGCFKTSTLLEMFALKYLILRYLGLITVRERVKIPAVNSFCSLHLTLYTICHFPNRLHPSFSVTTTAKWIEIQVGAKQMQF